MLPLIQYSRFVLLTSKGIDIINVSDVVRIEAISNYSKLYFTNGRTLVVAKHLRWFEGVLLTEQFVRVHRTHMGINNSFVSI